MILHEKLGGPYTLEDACAMLEREARNRRVGLRRASWPPERFVYPNDSIPCRVPQDALAREWFVWTLHAEDDFGHTNEGHEVWAAYGHRSDNRERVAMGPTFAVEPGIVLPLPYRRVKALARHVGLPVISLQPVEESAQKAPNRVG